MRFGKEKVEKSPKHEKVQFALSDILYTISPTLVILFSCLLIHHSTLCDQLVQFPVFFWQF